MYQVEDGSFDSVVTYVQGLDAGTSGGLLTGFYEFLLLRLGEDSNLAWSGLVERLAFPIEVPRPRTPTDEAVAIGALFDLLDEFLAEFLGRPHAIRRLYHEYDIWAMKQPGYTRDLIRFDSSPPWPHVSVDQAAAVLLVSRVEVFDMIARGTLRTGRVGPDVFLDESQVTHLADAKRGS